jgi:hypothetical protein
MVDLDKIKSRVIIEKLKNYKGSNEYILKLKNKLDSEGFFVLTTNQSSYITEHYETEPTSINKVVEITDYLSNQLKEKYNLKNAPKKVLVEVLLCETEKSYHVKGKLYQNQKESVLFYIPKTQILTDMFYEPYEDLEVDFDSVNKINKKKRSLFPHQEKAVKFLLKKNKSILSDDMGLGKAAAIDSHVLTPNGYVMMGDIKVGDYVIGSNGKPTEVIGVFPQGKKDLYKITFTDGTVVETCDEHLWAVQTTNHKKRGGGYVVKELKDLIGDLTYGNKGNLKWYIPIVEPVKFKKQKIGVDPYILGVLLGDGGISYKSRITLTNIDDQLLTEVSNRLPQYHQLKKGHGYSYSITCNLPNTQKGFNNEITKYLKEYGLMGTKSDTKFIPKNYIYNTKKIRLEVLQGLLDTDGYCSEKGTIQHYSVSKQLSDDVKEIIQSLGGIAKQTTKMGSYRLPNGQIKICKKSYILTINIPENIIPFRLSRKRKNMVTSKKYNPSRGIKNIEYSRTFEAQCISVEAEDHLYVMDEYVVTHNTKSAIAASLLSGAEKILVICPANAKINWFREITEYIDEEYVTIVKSGFWQPKFFTIINYDILNKFHEIHDKRKKTEPKSYINEENFDLIIVDEAHMVKNKDSIRGKIVSQITENVENVWLLTGTPIANRPMDYYNLLKICDVPVVSNFQHFAYRYCAAKSFKKKLKSGKIKRIWLTDGASNLEELHVKTKNYILRRKKEDHLELPPKIVSPFYLDLENKKGYDEAFKEYVEWMKLEGKKLGPARQMVEMTVLRKFISKEKIPLTIDMVNNFLEQSDERKIIIFTVFTESLKELKNHFGDIAVCHNGQMSDKEKQKSIDEFQNNPKIRIFIGNIISAGSAITLTASDTTIFHDMDFSASNHQQAEDRNYRISQDKTVNIYYPIFQESIEEKIFELLEKKKYISSTILGEKNNEYSILSDLILSLGTNT